jgi:hypothetical protein
MSSFLYTWQHTAQSAFISTWVDTVIESADVLREDADLPLPKTLFAFEEDFSVEMPYSETRILH